VGYLLLCLITFLGQAKVLHEQDKLNKYVQCVCMISVPYFYGIKDSIYSDKRYHFGYQGLKKKIKRYRVTALNARILHEVDQNFEQWRVFA
jgi:hypothetical protein